ncbi:hypothetical protein AB7C87_24110 [Natrarchaeobius sp. A-rgal3]|uniref:hypothetical protein n=1 Tax=Natrarchaeobius versutus TaxID=1679078 RepID=UPI003510CD32
MTASYRNASFSETIMDLNIWSALLLAIFTIATLIMTGLAIELVEFLTQWRFLPGTITLISLIGLFLASGTRDPYHYHPAEKLYIGAIAVFSVVFSAFDPFYDVVTGFYDPLGGIIVFGLMTIAAAVLMR